MVKRVLLVGLLGIILIALIGNEASARVCVLKNADGSCKLWSGSLECGISASGVGNIDPLDPVYLMCTATGTDKWAVACGNNGSNIWTAPGINLVIFSGTLPSEVYELTQYDVDRNGNAYGFAVAYPSASLLTALNEAGACPNLNWTAIDAVPCNLQLRDMQLNSNYCITSDAYYNCTLPSCGTLEWDTNTQSFERRQFECTKTGANTYKNPICPPSP